MSCCKVCGMGCACFFVLVVLLQVIMFNWAVSKCGPKELKDYSYPGGGKENLVPSNTLLIEQDPSWFANSFVVQPSDNVGLATGASTGVYFRTWGPLFWTYVYQDNLGQGTFYARDRPLALGGSHHVARCDGTGPQYIINEGNHVIMNAIRGMFGMYASRVYNIWQDGKRVAISEKVGGRGQSHKQIIFRAPEEANPFASAFLSDRHYHGAYDKWFVHDDKGETTLPAWVTNGATALMAFPTAQAKRAKHKAVVAMEKASVFSAAMPKGLEEAANGANVPSGFADVQMGLEEARPPSTWEGTPVARQVDAEMAAAVLAAPVVVEEQHV